MHFTPQVETREISDADLDNVSGGIVGDFVPTVTDTADSFAPVSDTAAGALGKARGATGFNHSSITNLPVGV